MGTTPEMRHALIARSAVAASLCRGVGTFTETQVSAARIRQAGSLSAESGRLPDFLSDARPGAVFGRSRP